MSRRRVGENREVARRLVQPGELQAGIMPGALGGLLSQRGGVAMEEILAHRRAPRRQIDQHKPPGLAQTDRWRETGKADEPLDRSVGQRVAAEPPHITPPGEQGLQARAKVRIEVGGLCHNRVA